MQELMEALRSQVDPFRERVSQIANVRRDLCAEDVEEVFEDIDVLQPLFEQLAETAHDQLKYSTMSNAYCLAESLAKFEIEAILLREECGAGKTRRLLEGQRAIGQRGQKILSQIAQLQEQENCL